MLRITGLAKTYRSGPPWRRRETPALRGIHLALDPGDTLALLGPNGAGKTTLLKILASLVTPDSGEIEIAGVPLSPRNDTASLVGLASGEERSLFFRLTARQNLDFFASLYGLDRKARERRIAELDDTLGLADFLDRRVDRCSSGMRARVGLARAFLHEPKLLLLDEPTKSLDPEHAETVRDVIRSYAVAGRAVIFTTHRPDEAEQIATRIVHLQDGHLREHPHPARPRHLAGGRP